MAAYSVAPHIRIDHDFFQYAPQIHGNGFMIFAYLLHRRNAKTGACFPSLKRIASDLGLDKKTVIKFLKILEDVGLIKKHANYKENRRTSNQYDILYWVGKARETVEKFLKPKPTDKPPEPLTLEEVAEATLIESTSVSPALTQSLTDKQQNCSHPAHARINPDPDYSFCNLCFAEVPTETDTNDE